MERSPSEGIETELRCGGLSQASSGLEHEGMMLASAAAKRAPTAMERLEGRLDELRGAQAYRAYLRARERVLAMLDREHEGEDGVHRPSAYWLEELANFAYLFDASPLVIEQLRHHTFHLTGLRVYEYRSHRAKPKALLEQKLRALIELGGADLLVPESRALGGFGFEIDGALYNVDTLKFFEVLIGLERAALLTPFRAPDRRRVVWEIGAGWGGFAYQFKTLFPETTYVVTDLPQTLLFSATYLMACFPEARVVFYGEGPGGGLPADWEEADFVFVPHTRLDVVRPERLDLAINMVSFQEMTTAQVERYAAHAFEVGCPFLYSLNRDRSPYNPDLTSVREVLGEHFWLHEVEVLPVSYTKMLDLPRKRLKRPKALAAADAGLDYRHVVGWRRQASR
jgi:hypothetical protein